MSYLPCPRCGEGFGCVCNTPIRTLPHWQPASTPTVGSADERVVRADRRERIATACLAGMIASPARSGKFEEYAFYAIRYADALIEELDKEAKP